MFSKPLISIAKQITYGLGAECLEIRIQKQYMIAA